MCGRKTLTKEKREIIKEYNVEESNWSDAEKYKPSYNIAPATNNPILIFDQKRHIKFMQWGLIPHWAKDKSIGQKMINARSETLMKRKTFRPLVEEHRCISIADGYYEWRGRKGRKQPYYIRKPDHGFISMAGLWSKWQSNQDQTTYSYTVITTNPAQKIKHIHDRMPAILNQKDINVWLEPKYSLEEALKLLKPYQNLEYYPVSKYVNSFKNDSPKCIQKMPQLFQ